MRLKILTPNTGHLLQLVPLYPFSTFHYCSVSCSVFDSVALHYFSLFKFSNALAHVAALNQIQP
jgi:hypothetical protein